MPVAFRGAAPRLVQVTALGVATLAAAAGLVYAVVSLAGSEVWWPSGGATGAGAFVAFPHPLRLIGVAWVLLWALTVAALAFVVADLARRIRPGVRFDRDLSRSVWAIAGVLGFGSFAAQATQNIASRSALVFDGGTAPGDPTAPISWGVRGESLVPDLPLLAVSVLFAVLAYIVGSGERLQRDSEGLV